MSNVTQEEFAEKYSDMMLNGLSSTNTYIPLRTNTRTGMNIAIRPYLVRESESVILLGGKFRVGFTLADGGGFESSKIEAISSDVMVKQLEDFCKGFSWMNKNEKRFSTTMFMGFAASKYDGEKALARIEDEGLAMGFLTNVQEMYAANNGVGFDQLQMAAEAMNDAWLIQGHDVFKDLPEVVQLSDKVLGKTSGVMNITEDTYKDNVVSFQEKVAALKAVP